MISLLADGSMWLKGWEGGTLEEKKKDVAR